VSETGVGTQSLDYLERPATADPEGTLVLLHGRGTDERDLFPLLDEIDPERRLLGLSPAGPLTGVPPGGKHWYESNVGHGVPPQLPPIVHEFVAAILDQQRSAATRMPAALTRASVRRLG
jgi:predicted esterase